MSHISLYRKFRPDTFEKMVRQESVIRVLKNQIMGQSVGHAYLFTGPRGTGKTSVARIFARAVNCKNPQNGSPCLACEVCRAIENSLDITEIDAASNNGVAEMRDLREKVQYPPTVGRYKVYIIDEVHMLTDSAFNALLKTLEEPPQHVIFILATTEPHKIPATILSRCMRMDFKLIPVEDLEAHLKSVLDAIGKPYDNEAVSVIARAGAGSDRDMLSIAEMCVAYSDKLTYNDVTAVLGAADFETTASLIECVLKGDTGESLAAVERALSEGKSAGVMLRDILEMVRQISICKACRDADKILSLPKELFARVRKTAEGADGRTILRATEIFAKCENELRFAQSPAIALETAVARACLPQTQHDIDSLLVRVAQLEETVKRGGMYGVAPADSPSGPTVPQTGTAERERPIAQPVSEKPLKKEEPVPLDDGYLPPEEPFFAEESYSPLAPSSVAPEKAVPKPEPPKEKPSSAVAVAQGDAPEVVFGKFMRLLRKTSKNGVLFTMCADLAAAFEGARLVLTTESETIYRSLQRDAHRATMQEVFSEIGVTEFEIRNASAQTAPKGSAADLKRDFSNYPVNIK